MRVLQINKFFWRSGGAEGYMLDLSALLASRGHEVIHFAMEDPRNLPSPQARYFASRVDYRGMGLGGGLRKARRVLAGTVYSFESREKLARLLRDLRPDIAHVHLIDHHLSPSVLDALREASVPAVMTAHDYKLICPNYQMYVARTREICGRCVPGRYYRCVARRCFRDSLAASALAAGAMYIHRAMNLFDKNLFSVLHATEFLGAKLAEGGVNPGKLVHVPLYIDRARFVGVSESRDSTPPYIAYAGRLSPEKGLHTLMRAMRELPDVRLALLGDGPERAALETEARGLPNVEFSGFLDGEPYARKLAGARLLVLPSESYETCGLVAWEAHALGVPVVASRIGGIPESVTDGETGLLFAPGNPADLAESVQRMLGDDAAARAMGAAGRARVNAHCDAHYDRIRAVYDRAIAGAAA